MCMFDHGEVCRGKCGLAVITISLQKSNSNRCCGRLTEINSLGIDPGERENQLKRVISHEDMG